VIQALDTAKCVSYKDSGDHGLHVVTLCNNYDLRCILVDKHSENNILHFLNNLKHYFVILSFMQNAQR